MEDRIQNVSLYQELLEKFYGFYAPLEAEIEALPDWKSWSLDFTKRRKRVWLEEDLSALGLDAAQIKSLPMCTDLPQVSSLAEGFGCAYVLEGSTLGGRQISSLLEQSQTPQNARAFFRSYGSDVGLKWKEFLAALENFSRNHLSQEPTVQAANNTFTSLQKWMGKGETLS